MSKPTEKYDANAESNALLNELEDDLKRQKLEELVIDNGGKIIGLAVFIVAIASAIYFYNQYIYKSNLNAGIKFYNILETSKTTDEKISNLQNSLKDLPKGFSSLAELRIADDLIQKNDLEGAKKQLEAVAKNSKYDQALREVAELKLVDILIKQKENEQDILKRLDALSQPNSVFKYSAIEMKITYFMANERKQDAKDLAKKLADDNVTPQNIIKRVTLITE